jgi:hypothetical protein
MEPEPPETLYKDMIAQTLENPLRFGFLGDLLLGGEFITYAKKNKIAFLKPFEQISQDLKNCDIIFFNLEGPIFQGLNKRSDVTSILSNNLAIIDFLTGHKLCVLNLANNHIMDYGVEGLNHTLSLLNKNNLNYVGAGNNETEANRERVIQCKGKRISFVSYTSNQGHVRSIIAGPKRPGCATFQNLDGAVKQIQELKQKTDIVCVSIHWGYEYFQYPSPSQIETAHLLVDAGANFIIGHHPHVIQGIEKYKNSLIIYSLGNFFFPPFRARSGRIQHQKKISREYMIVRSEITKDAEINYDFIGGMVNRKYLLIPFNEKEQRNFCLKIKELSSQFDGNNYEKFWSRYEQNRIKELIKESLYEAFNKLIEIPVTDLMREIKLDDIKRNMKRILRVIIRK